MPSAMPGSESFSPSFECTGQSSPPAAVLAASGDLISRMIEEYFKPERSSLS